VSIERVDDEHGNVLPKYAAMGSPLDPTESQVEQLNRETALGQPERTRLKDGRLELTLERNALTVLHVTVRQ
jgi:xylan 1,4-beta-xylosidase